MEHLDDGAPHRLGAARPSPPPGGTGVSLWLHVILLPVWFALTAGVTVGIAGAGTDWVGVLLLALLGYPVAVVAAVLLVRSAERRGDGAAARRWRLLPMPWVVAMVGFIVWALER